MELSDIPIFFLPFILTLFLVLSFVSARKFPPKKNISVHYRHAFSSGYVGSRLLAFRNCLMITVTNDELWINSFPPFSGLAFIFNSVHRVSANNVKSVTVHINEMEVQFFDDNGALRTLVISDTKNMESLHRELTRLISSKTIVNPEPA